MLVLGAAHWIATLLLFLVKAQDSVVCTDEWAWLPGTHMRPLILSPVSRTASLLLAIGLSSRIGTLDVADLVWGRSHPICRVAGGACPSE